MSVAQRFKDIADAIREKTGSDELITPLQMPDAIRAIETGGYMHNYSTEEQVIGTWINGKPLYEVVIENSSLSSSIDVSPYNIETLVETNCLGGNKGGCVVENGSPISGVRWVLNSTTDNNAREIYLDNNTLIINGADYFFDKGNVILRYTKTTDTATT